MPVNTVNAANDKDPLGPLPEQGQDPSTSLDPPPPRTAEEFYVRYKDWVDEQNLHVEKYGIWNEEFRTW